MAFTQASAAIKTRPQCLLSADNTHPERHIIIDTVRQAAPLLGIKASVIATLDAMLSCLPPKRRHNTVFASNATLAFRRNGISDRTIRRHAAILQELGLLSRHDSSNRKRFCRRNTTEGITLRFGFDLTPLFQRFSELADLAARALREQEQISYLKTKVRTAANEILKRAPGSIDALDAIRTLRRKISLESCRLLLKKLNAEYLEAELPCDISDHDKEKLSGSNGQNVRHHHKSKKENTDKGATLKQTQHPNASSKSPLSVDEILKACPEALQFSLHPVRTMPDIISHARTLAPMVGIDTTNFNQAQQKIGIEGTALTIWAIMQFHERIRQVGAYFRSVTTGEKSANFSPNELIRRLSKHRVDPDRRNGAEWKRPHER